MEEKGVLVAGATGYPGQYTVKESKKQGYWVRALTRDQKKLAHLRFSQKCGSEIGFGSFVNGFLDLFIMATVLSGLA